MKTPAAQPLLLTGRMEPRRLARRRFLFFTAIFVLTSVAAWFMADLLWRDGLTGIESALLVRDRKSVV